MNNEQYDQQMEWEADQNANDEAMANEAHAMMEEERAIAEEEFEVHHSIMFLEKRGYKIIKPTDA